MTYTPPLYLDIAFVTAHVSRTGRAHGNREGDSGEEGRCVGEGEKSEEDAGNAHLGCGPDDPAFDEADGGRGHHRAKRWEWRRRGDAAGPDAGARRVVLIGMPGLCGCLVSGPPVVLRGRP